ncbi:MAG: transcription antitermination factor NusB [Oscillospiraceae bacterium]|nr:transcription antitermination factor NusB [Oscillospiraceae bacterium]
MKKITRHQMRENAFVLIFERIFHEDSVEELLSTARECGDLEITPEVERMFRGVEGNRAVIDETISAHLKKWTMSRISKVSLAILRLGVWEIFFCDDVEDDIVVSECVRLATDYAYEDDVSFINGVLGSIVRDKIAGAGDKAAGGKE